MALKRTGIKRGTKGLAPGKPLQRKSELRSRSQLKSTKRLEAKPRASSVRTPPPRKATPDPITAVVRAEVDARSGGACEVRASRKCMGRATHKHHRKLRRHNDHRAVNILNVCTVCHTEIHTRTGLALAAGMLVRSTDAPESVPLVVGPLQG